MESYSWPEEEEMERQREELQVKIKGKTWKVFLVHFKKQCPLNKSKEASSSKHAAKFSAVNITDGSGYAYKSKNGVLKVTKGSLVKLRRTLRNGLYVLEGTVVSGVCLQLWALKLHMRYGQWIYKIKPSTRGDSKPRYKARLVAKGYTQKEGVDFHEIFSLVVRWTSPQHFFMEKLEEVIYMAQPKGYEVKGKEDMVLSSSQVYLWIEVISKTVVYQVWLDLGYAMSMISRDCDKLALWEGFTDVDYTAKLDKSLYQVTFLACMVMLSTGKLPYNQLLLCLH
ncbi:Retrovirus-related Pol polyprotein from transposon TNT 1-94 [Cucumis melo var. makuwa]|uniref:Retrovirus-related Pol polyprotein from transposon TNT 1-94 n=1 Tax=Cucumis melo var. makuwa TaxID=1194695 RepID=A0A5D3D6F1_CUCMM|nr:Retrovirus-related Pol polyprotein from transposon TNT 1-94 [Cucumis melo var. makuwa]TYK19144.1 Retrovirus-related Pol polyprotein from transposon TNT 1-94 [Cucumis melo var. makuwa]